MSSRRIAAVLTGYDLWNRGEYEQVARGYHDDFAYEVASGMDVFAGAIRDRASIAAGWTQSSPEWAEFVLEPESVEELGPDHVLVVALARARGARSGVELAIRYWHLFEYRGSKVARLRSFESREEALAAYRGEGG